MELKIENVCDKCQASFPCFDDGENCLQKEENRLKVMALGTPLSLEVNKDFYINDKGLYVFTGWYLLRRGTCCSNDCLHCPYK